MKRGDNEQVFLSGKGEMLTPRHSIYPTMSDGWREEHGFPSLHAE